MNPASLGDPVIRWRGKIVIVNLPLNDYREPMLLEMLKICETVMKEWETYSAQQNLLELSSREIYPDDSIVVEKTTNVIVSIPNEYEWLFYLTQLRDRKLKAMSYPHQQLQNTNGTAMGGGFSQPIRSPSFWSQPPHRIGFMTQMHTPPSPWGNYPSPLPHHYAHPQWQNQVLTYRMSPELGIQAWGQNQHLAHSQSYQFEVKEQALGLNLHVEEEIITNPSEVGSRPVTGRSDIITNPSETTEVPKHSPAPSFSYQPSAQHRLNANAPEFKSGEFKFPFTLTVSQSPSFNVNAPEFKPLEGFVKPANVKKIIPIVSPPPEKPNVIIAEQKSEEKCSDMTNDERFRTFTFPPSPICRANQSPCLPPNPATPIGPPPANHNIESNATLSKDDSDHLSPLQQEQSNVSTTDNGSNSVSKLVSSLAIDRLSEDYDDEISTRPRSRLRPRKDQSEIIERIVSAQLHPMVQVLSQIQRTVEEFGHISPLERNGVSPSDADDEDDESSLQNGQCRRYVNGNTDKAKNVVFSASRSEQRNLDKVSEMNAVIQNLKAELKTCESNIAIAKDIRSSLEKRISQLENELENTRRAAKESVGEAERQLLEVERERADRDRRLVEANERLAVLEKSHGALQTSVGELTIKSAVLQSSLSEAELSNEKVNLLVEEFRSNNFRLQTELEGLRIQKELLASTHEQLLQKYAKLEEDMVRSAAEIAEEQRRWRTCIEETGAEKLVLERRMEEESRRTRQLSGELQRAQVDQREVVKLRVQLEEVNALNRRLEAAMENIRVDLDQKAREDTEHAVRVALQDIRLKQESLESRLELSNLKNQSLRNEVSRLEGQIREKASVASAKEDIYNNLQKDLVYRIAELDSAREQIKVLNHKAQQSERYSQEVYELKAKILEKEHCVGQLELAIVSSEGQYLKKVKKQDAEIYKLKGQISRQSNQLAELIQGQSPTGQFSDRQLVRKYEILKSVLKNERQERHILEKEMRRLSLVSAPSSVMAPSTPGSNCSKSATASPDLRRSIFDQQGQTCSSGYSG